MTPQDPWRPYEPLGLAERLCVPCGQRGPTNAEGLCDTCYEISGLKAEVKEWKGKAAGCGALESWGQDWREHGAWADAEVRRLKADNAEAVAERDDHADMLDRISELVGVSTEYDESHVLLEDAIKENVADLAEAVALLEFAHDTTDRPSLYRDLDAFLARHTETKGESHD